MLINSLFLRKFVSSILVWQDYKSVDFPPHTSPRPYIQPLGSADSPLELMDCENSASLTSLIHSYFKNSSVYQVLHSHFMTWKELTCARVNTSKPSEQQGARQCAGCGQPCWLRLRPSAKSLHSPGGQPARSTSKGSGQTGPHGPAARDLL